MIIADVSTPESKRRKMRFRLPTPVITGVVASAVGGLCPLYVMDYMVIECRNAKGEVSCVTKVDPEDYEYLKSYYWSAARFERGGNLYVIRGLMKNGKHTTSRMHRQIMGYPNGLEVDHRNGDTLDNRKSNLRVCTKGQNCQNRKLRSDSQFKYKGIHRTKDSVKWAAKIGKDKKRYYLGAFNDEESAARAYDRAAKKLFGEFALLNFPEGG